MSSLIIPAAKKHTATVIMAHGLGDSGAGWVSLGENWRRRAKFDEVKFVFPNAPTIPISVNFGMQMPGWYDIKQFNNMKGSEDEPGILKSQKVFHDLIDAEIASGIPANRIVIGGFSQGGAMSIFSGVTYPKQLGGIFALSSYLLLESKVFAELAPAGVPNKNTPIFMGHGDQDPLVLPDWGRRTEKALTEAGYKVELKWYKGLQHSADPQEIDDVEKYLVNALSSKAEASSSATSPSI